MGTGIKSTHIPSLCEYTNASIAQSDKVVVHTFAVLYNSGAVD
jgi:hypothetical protein